MEILKGAMLITIIMQIITFLIGVIESLTKPEEDRGNRRLIIPVKATLTLSFVVLGALAFILGEGELKEYYAFILPGIIAAFFGDLTMGYYIKFKNNIVAGMKIFAVTHLFYIGAYVKMISIKNSSIAPYIPVLIILYMSFVFVFWNLKIKNLDKYDETMKSAFLYTALILAMVVTSVVLYITLGGKWFITVIGALIFLFSDALIAYFYILKKSLKIADILIWLTYVGAQMAIVNSGMLVFL